MSTLRRLGIVATALLALHALGCGGKSQGSPAGRSGIQSREDSLLAVIAAAKTSAELGTSILRKEQIDSLAAVPESDGGREPSAKPAAPASAPVSPRPQSAVAAAGSSAPGFVLTQSDTAGSVERALKSGAAMVMVDSGSAEDKRLDSLMLVAESLSASYRAYVLTHTHKNLALQAHQDPAKQRRLLLAISAARDKSTLFPYTTLFRSLRRERIKNRAMNDF